MRPTFSRAAGALLVVPAASAAQGVMTTWVASQHLGPTELASFTSVWAVGISLSVALMSGLEMAGLRFHAVAEPGTSGFRFYAVALPFASIMSLMMMTVIGIGGRGYPTYLLLLVGLQLIQLPLVGIRVTLIYGERYALLGLAYFAQSALVTTLFAAGLIVTHKGLTLDQLLAAQIVAWGVIILLTSRLNKTPNRSKSRPGGANDGICTQPQLRVFRHRWPTNGLRIWHHGLDRTVIITAMTFSAITIAETIPFSVPLVQGTRGAASSGTIAFYGLYGVFARGVTTLVNSQAPRFTRMIGTAAYASNGSANSARKAREALGSIWKNVILIALIAHCVFGIILIPLLVAASGASAGEGMVIAGLLIGGEVLLLRSSLLRIAVGMTSSPRAMFTVAFRSLPLSLSVVAIVSIFDLPFALEYIVAPYGLIIVYSLLLDQQLPRSTV